MENARRMYVPTMWLEMRADVTPDLGWWLNMALKVPVVGTATFFSLVCISMLAVAISGVILVKRRSRSHPIATAVTVASTSTLPSVTSSTGSHKIHSDP